MSQIERWITRTLTELLQTPLVYSDRLKRWVVPINTQEAIMLFHASAEVSRPSNVEADGKRQFFRYGGRLFVWMAGITCPANHEFPVLETEPALRDCA